jgi:hypothetical protein
MIQVEGPVNTIRRRTFTSERSEENDVRSFQRDCTVCRSPPHRKVLEFTVFRWRSNDANFASSRLGFNKPT